MRSVAIIVTAAMTGLTVCSAAADETAGSAFGNLQTASAIGQGRGDFGMGVGVTGDATSFVGWFQYGLAPYIDGRLKLGIIDPDGGDAEVTFGTDFKYQIWEVTSAVTNPLDLAVGGFLEYVDFGDGSVLQIGGHVIGSYPFTLDNGTVLSPYGRFNTRIERFDNHRSDSELRFGLNGGVAWEVTSTVTLYGEFQVDGNDGVFFGASFGVL